jgi:UDPglucose--hexose-1-phosphate uridylyltransferase
MSVYKYINALADYAIEKGLIEPTDRRYTVNQILMTMGLDEIPEDAGTETGTKLNEILEALTDDAVSRGLVNDDITSRDLFDTRLMGLVTDRPSHVIEKFNSLYKESPEAATDWFYGFAQDTNYIRRDRIAKDKKWVVESPYGDIDISINLSKPEKDPRAIAAAKLAKASSYPKCQLCMENEGYAGRMNHPARENHRIIPIGICGQPWGFQYSPYVYYNEHCIVLSSRHEPMKVERLTFEKLFSFVEQFPHYFLGSNADLPIVGGSILSHDHFQGGRYTFAMEKAGLEREFTVPGYERVRAGIVNWPLSVIRLSAEDPKDIIDLAEHILKKWRSYTDEAAFIFAETDGEPHNTITPIARKRGELFELDLALRNNITTEEYPLGVYHPHSEYHHIKKENIGLIEVMGLAILPARLNTELELMKAYLKGDIASGEKPELAIHEPWLEGIKARQGNTASLTDGELEKLLQDEMGQVFVKILENAGVFKCTTEGRKAFMRFIGTL